MITPEAFPIDEPDAVRQTRRLIQDPGSSRFEEVALAVFAYQFRENPPYRRFCEHRGRTPDQVKDWSEIPLVPTSAFKDAELTTAPARQIFLTSGTTRGKKRGRHALPDLGLYEAAWEQPFRKHLLPDRDEMRVLSLIPGFEALPESSLSFMVDRIVKRFGGAGSRSFLGPDGLHTEGLRLALQEAVHEGSPVMILTTALAVAEFLQILAASDERFELPSGSRIMDTGGAKGTHMNVSREELLNGYRELLGVQPGHVVGEYGMTELCSQFYENSLSDRDPAPVRRYEGPPWTRTRVLDPETLEHLPDGERGLLAHWDLANAWTVSAVLTEDLGVVVPSGFQLRGRAEGAELRGCSLVAEEILRHV
jgi:hypothetical protein